MERPHCQTQRVPLTILTRVNIDPRTMCWEWQREINSQTGYGQIGVRRRKLYAHRLSYEIFRGPIPEGLTIDHLCRNRRCVNPFHLEAVTIRVNLLRGDGVSACHARQTHCQQGHEYTPSNTYRFPVGAAKQSRRCRICTNAYNRRKRYARKAAKN